MTINEAGDSNSIKNLTIFQILKSLQEKLIPCRMVVFVSEEISPHEMTFIRDELNQRGHLTKTGAMNLACVCL